MITPEMLLAAISSAGEGHINLHDMADHLNRAAWRDVATDPPPEGDRVLFLWDSGSCAIGSAWRGVISTFDRAFDSDDGPHYWQPLPQPPGDE